MSLLRTGRRPRAAADVLRDPIPVTTYELGPGSITCLVCGWTSYNPHDRERHYCGRCHAWHDLPATFGERLLARLAPERPS